ncbi:MAG: phosphatase PAP2 family protein [Eubacteriaceae bacterium]
MAIRNQIHTLWNSEIERLTIIDTIALRKIKIKMRSPGMTRFMDTLTLAGTSGLIWLTAGWYMMRRKSTRLNGLILFIVVAQNVIVNNLVTKSIFRRPRPCSVEPEEYMHHSFPAGFSFPSGHTLTSFSGATILAIADWRNAFWAFPLAAGIGFSRMYLYAHYPSDVIAGAVDGLISGAVDYWAGHRVYDDEIFPFLNRWVDRTNRVDKKDLKIEEATGQQLSDRPVLRSMEINAYKKEQKALKNERKRLKKEKHHRFFLNIEKAVEIVRVIRE